MADKGNLILGNFNKAGHHSRALTDAEARLIDKDEQSRWLKEYHVATALADLQAVLNLYNRREDRDIYKNFAKTLSGFRSVQSGIVTTYTPNLTTAYIMAAKGHKPYQIVEEILHPELERARKHAVSVESRSYAHHLRHAVASETGHIIYGLMNVLGDIDDRKANGEVKTTLLSPKDLTLDLREYAVEKCDVDALFKKYVARAYVHINAMRHEQSVKRATHPVGGENVVPFQRGRKPHLTLVK